MFSVGIERMCGIWFRLGPMMVIHNPKTWIQTLSPRGPESMTVTTLSGDITLGFTRLAINGLSEAGMQPFGYRNLVWMCNGEIYNWKDLAYQHGLLHLHSGSDCEVLGYLYELYKDNLPTLFRMLDGVFAFILVDKERQRVIVARDPYGVRPLYMGTKFEYKHENGNTFSVGTQTLFWSSELKGLIPISDHVGHFPPGTFQVYDIPTKKLLHSERYHTVPWIKNPFLSSANPSGLDMACASLRFALEEAVKKRMLTERPVAALLSGGIDSSLIASLVQKHLRQLGKPPLKTFSIGMQGSEDLRHARMVADWIRSDHTEIVLTADDFFKAIPSVIRAIETYDTTSVRASVGNWLVCKAIKEKCDAKVVFNGDGSDEVFGSYLYFYRAPTLELFEEESQRLLDDIYMFDVQRSDRSISSHGLEPRTPFLDKQFVSVARSIPAYWRRPTINQMEKWILRRAFDDGVTLPRDVLWRRKEAFSDGVSSKEKSWYQEIQERVLPFMPPDWKEKAERHYEHLSPQTPEQYYYRYMFEAEFSRIPVKTCIPYFWMPRWCPETTDPSARTLAVYNESSH
jgi:asparagine synthase (glutamine-hydrolysing)